MNEAVFVEKFQSNSVCFVFPRCLTFGLPREGDAAKKDEKFDEKEYQRYEDIRSKMNIIFDDAAEIHKSKIQMATSEEVCGHELNQSIVRFLV